jgi:hypothetical protein
VRSALVSDCYLKKNQVMMGAARTSETLINFYQTTRRYNPEDSHLRTHRRENLKSYKSQVRCEVPRVDPRTLQRKNKGTPTNFPSS